MLIDIFNALPELRSEATPYVIGICHSMPSNHKVVVCDVFVFILDVNLEI